MFSFLFFDFGLVILEISQFLLPLGGLIRSAGFLVELHEKLERLLDLRLPAVGVGNRLVLPLLHAFVTVKEQRRSFGVFFLAQQAFAQKNPGAEGGPGFW